MEVKESTIDSEIYRFLANIVDTGFEYNSVKFTKVEFHYPIPKPNNQGKPDEADIVIFAEKESKPIKLVIEAKGRDTKKTRKLDPYSVSVIGQALGYAKAIGAQFIATTNGDMFLLFDAFINKPLLETQIGSNYKIRWDLGFFQKLLQDLSSYINGTLKLLPLDYAFVARLKYFHELLSQPAYISLKEKLKTDFKFQSEYKTWLEEQGFKFTNATHETIAKQFAYILMNRVLFYKTLETRKKDLNLIKLESQDEENFDPDLTISSLKKCFEKVVRDVDYEAVFQHANVLDDIPITTVLAEYLNDLIKDLELYNLSNIKRDVIGHVYEQLIPPDERKRLGQYYTPPLICDLIAKICINKPDSKVLDPSCGSGGFLLSAYSRLLDLTHKKESDEKLHNYILSHIYGIDINQFAAHLSVVNLSIRNLDADTDKVNVMASDFFKISANEVTLLPRKRVSMRGYEETYHTLTADFDVVITNPPYTRQDDIGDEKYVDFIRKVALKIDKKELKLSSEAGIYTYFFTHAFHFLKEGGLLGYIVSNSWMDVKFGKDLQKFFLDNFKIKYIIDFDKRSFEEAAVNTVIVILQKLSGKTKKNERDNNLVKFVRIKESLKVDEIINLIEKSNTSYENNVARYVLVKQKDLYGDYKWNKYLRAPEIYYKITASKKFTKLRNVANLTVGYVTLADTFFLIDKTDANKLGIEKDFLFPVLVHTNEVKYLDTDQNEARKMLLIINKPKSDLSRKNILKYIEVNENKSLELTRGHEKGKIVHGYQNLPGLKNKSLWYSLPYKAPPEILVPRLIWNRWYAVWNKAKILTAQNFYWIYPKVKSETLVLLGFLNSTLAELFVEIEGKTSYGEGVIQLVGHNFLELPVLDPEKLTNKEKKQIEDLFLMLCEASREKNEKTILNIKNGLDDIIFNIIGIKGAKEQVYKELENLRLIRKSKKETEVMIKK